MQESKIRALLERVHQGDLSVDDALSDLRDLPFKEIGYATVDHHRSLRLGFPEVVLGSCKTPDQIAGILAELGKGGDNVLVTRVSPEKARAVADLCPDVESHPQARGLVLRRHPVETRGRGPVLVVTAGTGDIPVAEEACLTAELMGNQLERMYDVGVAGIHRVLNQRDRLAKATVVIVVAGMEGALASVVGGLVPRPVIAVPTSVGYGASFSGIAALLGMLNSCAAGVAVVNIDNGFGAAYVASLINRVADEIRSGAP
jgi:NCAIR mutase (PurE)-related protein